LNHNVIYPFGEFDPVAERLCVESARGPYYFLTGGGTITDLASGLWSTSLGHSYPPLIQAAKDQIDRLSYVPTWNGLGHSLDEHLALSLLTLGGPEFTGGDVYFASGGASGIDAALKIAQRACFERHGRTGFIVAVEGGYHGTHVGSTAVSGEIQNRTTLEYGISRNDVVFVRANEPGAWELVTDQAKHRPVAAVLMEPMLGTDCVLLTDAFLSAASAICDDTGALLITDEVSCGLYRCDAPLLGVARGLRPDLVILSKALTNGMYPLSAVLLSRRLRHSLSGYYFQHGESQSGNPVGCRIAIEVLRSLESQEIQLSRCRVSATLDTALDGLLRSNNSVSAIEGLGCFRSIRLIGPAPRKVWSRALENGVLLHPGVSGVTVCINFLMADDEILDSVDVIAKCLSGG